MSAPSVISDRPKRHQCFECNYCGIMYLDDDRYTCITIDNFGSFKIAGPESICSDCYNDAKAYACASNE